MQIRFKKVRPSAQLPRYMTAGAAGMDLTCAADGDITLLPGARDGVPTGLAIEIPEGYEAQVRPRSGLARKQGLTLINAPGTIDSDYRGEIVVLMINLSQEPQTIRPGDRIAQLVIAPIVQAQIVETDILVDTARGAGGFGSTG